MAMSVRFNNLKDLLNDMRSKNRIIEAFPFNYNQRQYAVILTRYKPDEPRLDYAQAKLEFFNLNSENSIFAYADFYEVHFKNATDFINFLKLMFRLALRQSEKFFRILVFFLQISFQHKLKKI